MPSESEKCNCTWTANNVCTVIAALTSSTALIIGMLNHEASLDNGAKIQAVQTEAADVKADLHRRSDAVDKKLEGVQKTTDSTAVKVGAAK